LIKDLFEINIRALHDLWNVCFIGDNPSGLYPRLVFPKKRGKNKKNKDVIRVSEQEARIVYCNVLNNLNYFYSVETPTENKYKLSGKTGVSALSDLSVYTYIEEDNENNNKNNDEKKYFKKIVNVEFKANSPVKKNFVKDIKKIVKEKEQGNWFHLLKNVDRATLPSVFRKLVCSFKECEGEGIEKSILFCICIFKKKWGMLKIFNYKPSSGKNIINLMEGFFCLDKNNVSNNIDGKDLEAQKNTLKNNGWTIIEQKYLKG